MGRCAYFCSAGDPKGEKIKNSERNNIIPLSEEFWKINNRHNFVKRIGGLDKWEIFLEDGYECLFLILHCIGNVLYKSQCLLGHVGSIFCCRWKSCKPEML